MGVKISNTASSPNAIIFPEGPWDMQSSVAISILFTPNTSIVDGNRLFCKNVSASTVQSWGLRFSTNQLSGSWYESTVQLSATIIDSVTFSNNGLWSQVILVYDASKSSGDKAKVYVNGQFVLDFDTVTTNPDVTATAFSIGKDQRTGNNGAPIDVAEFEVYEGAFSIEDARIAYNGGRFLRFQDMGYKPSHYYPLLGGGSMTKREKVGSLNATGSGVTPANRHPAMWYLSKKGRSRPGMRGR